MDNARHIGRVGALAVALGVGFAVVATPAVGYAEPTASASCRPPDSADLATSALILGGTTVPTPDDAYIDTVKNHYIAPTHAGQDINNYCAVTAPMEAWPVTGIGRLVWFAVGPESIWGLGGPAWPDEPWWKLSGLFDLTFDQSVRGGVADLEAAMATYGNDHLVIYGYSQGAIIANLEKRKLAEQYPARSSAPDIDFVLSGDLNLPNGGLLARFPGLYIPILDVSFNGPEATDTQFDTVVITRQYDGFADFPLYPLKVISLLNALLGAVYLHPYDLEVSLAPDPSISPPIKSEHGDTTYYFFETEDLPLFAPLRSLGVPEPMIDVVEPFFREIVELGYDRSIKPWEPMPARLIPMHDPVTVAADLVAAIGQGIDNAFALFDSPLPLKRPAPFALAAPGTETAKAGTSPRVTSTGAATGTQQTSTDVAPPTTKMSESANPHVSLHLTPTETVHEIGRLTSARDAIETGEAGEASAGPTEASVPDAPADASTLNAAKPVDRPVTPLRVVRASLGVGRQPHDRPHDRPHRGSGDHRTARAPVAGGAAAERSSFASSPAAGSNSSGRD